MLQSVLLVLLGCFLLYIDEKNNKETFELPAMLLCTIGGIGCFLGLIFSFC